MAIDDWGPLDLTSISTPQGAVDAVFKKSSAYNYYGKKSIFKAQVITPPRGIGGDAAMATGQSADGEDPAGLYICNVRFIGRNMAHNKFIPDPCDISIASDTAAVTQLNTLHTRVTLPLQSGDILPAQNDIIEVALEPGANNSPFDLQIGKFLKISQVISAVSAQPQESQGCASLEGLFDNIPFGGGGLFGGSGPGKRGGNAPGGFGSGGKNADKLRCFAKNLHDTGKLVVWEKYTQLSDAGDINEELAIATANVLQQLSEKMPGLRVKITAGRDKSHAGRNSRHNAGMGLDFALDPKPTPDKGWSKHTSEAYATSDDVRDVANILSGLALSDKQFKFIDEYNYPSGYASGPHFHISYGRDSWESKKTKQFFKTNKHLAPAAFFDYEILDKC